MRLTEPVGYLILIFFLFSFCERFARLYVRVCVCERVCVFVYTGLVWVLHPSGVAIHNHSAVCRV